MTNSYPVLDTKSALTVGNAIELWREEKGSTAGFDDSSFVGLIKTRPCRVDFNEETLAQILHEFKANRAAIAQSSGTKAQKRNEQDEEFSASAIKLVNQLPIEAIQDLDFWRYLSVFKLRDYISSTEGDFTPNRYGGNGNRNIIRWTLIRGLVWGLHCISGEDSSYIYKARQVKEGLGLGSEVRDFYISHVVRPEWTKAPGAGPAFIDASMSEPPLFDRGKEFRPSQYFGARIARLSTNLYFPALSQEELTTMMLDEREGIPHEPKADGIS